MGKRKRENRARVRMGLELPWSLRQQVEIIERLTEDGIPGEIVAEELSSMYRRGEK